MKACLFEQVVAQVNEGKFFEDKEILKLHDEDGRTVAHVQAEQGWITEDKEILKLKDISGWTVAHQQVVRRWITEDPEILVLATIRNILVAEVQACYSGWTPEEETREKFVQELRKNFPEEKAQEILHNVDSLAKEYFKKILFGR